MRFKGTGQGDDIHGTDASDEIVGAGGSDFLYGGGGADRIAGGAGDDFLVTNGIFDSRFGNAAADPDAVPDTALGGDGDDRVIGGWNDTLGGGGGLDELNLDLRGATSGVTIDLGRQVGGGRVRNGDGWISGFEAYGLILGSAGDDDLRVGGLQSSSRRLFPGIYGGDGNDRIDARGALPAGGGRFGYDLNGDAGDDVLIGGAAPNSLYGGHGADRLVAGDASDALYGGAGDDILDARAFGSDLANGSGGFDTLLLSGRGGDWTTAIELRDGAGGTEVVVSLSREQAQPNGASGRTVSVIEVEAVSFAVRTLTFAELIAGTVIGTDGDDLLGPGTTVRFGTEVTDGDDTVYGAGGSDVLDGGGGADTLYGGIGNFYGDTVADTFLLRDAGDRVMDAGQGDVIRAWVDVVGNVQGAHNGRIALVELMGTDDSDAAVGAARVIGNAGDNHLTGTGVLEGGAGDDVLESFTHSPSFDTAVASYEHAASRVTVDLGVDGAQDTRGAGRDTLVGINNLIGSAQDDTLAGSAADDLIEGGAGDDRIDGRDGNDFASYAHAAKGVTVDLTLTGAQATRGGGVDTLISVEGVLGSDFADRLAGDAGANVLDGGGGNDVLSGGDGRDRLTGGAGADRFVFDDTILSSNFGEESQGLDQVADFDRTERDRIDLAAVDADTTRAGDQAFTLVKAFTAHPGELFVGYLTEGGPQVFAGDVDGDGQADFQVAFGSSGTVVPEASFVL